MSEIQVSILLKSISRLGRWLEKNGCQGYDPYDIKALPWVLNLTKKGNNSRFWAIIRELIFESFYTCPILSRKIFRIKKEINPKAIGLFASSYLDLYKITNEKEYFEKSRFYLDWLLNNKTIINNGSGWGYSFDWQSNQRIPRNTPNGIVTTAVGDAFWNFYQFTGEQKFLEECIQICKFLVSLPIDKTEPHRLCFSYTPVFINHIHNLNLFVAEFLIKIGNQIRNMDWIHLGEQAVNYTLAAQMENGSFDYNGPPEKPMNLIDHYHTGFVLRMLHSIWKLTRKDHIYHALKRCYEHYIQNFFHNDIIPKLKPDKLYRIDIHSCSESIFCLSELSDIFPESLEKAGKVLEWTINNFQDSQGYFYYGFLKSRLTGIVFKSKIPYIRWGQAWMLRAMSKFLMKTKQINS